MNTVHAAAIARASLARASLRMTSKLRSATEAAREYVAVMADLADANNFFISDLARMEKEIAELMHTSKDRTKSDREQMDALEQAFALEKKIMNFKKTQAVSAYDALISKIAGQANLTEELVKQFIELDAEQQKNLLTTKVFNTLWEEHEEDIIKAENAYASIQKTEQDYFQGTLRMQSQLTSLQEEQRKKRIEEAEIAATVADRKLEIGEMEVQSFGLLEETKTKLEAQELELRTRAQEDYYERMEELSEEDKERKVKAAQDAVMIAAQTGQQLLDITNFMLDAERGRLEQQKAYELQLAGDNAERRAMIEEKYDKRMKELKIKQAKADKAAAIFKSIINIAQAVTAMLSGGPVIGIVMAALAAAIGAVQIGVIASQPIPQFFKGTDSAPDGVISIGEKGRELIKTKSGQLLLANDQTLATGLKGAKIFTNKETEAMLRGGAFGYDSQELRNTLERNNDRLIRTIQNKKEIHINTSKREITERSGRFYTTYKNRYFK